MFQILIIVGIFGAFIGVALFMVALQCGWTCIANLGTLIVVLTGNKSFILILKNIALAFIKKKVILIDLKYSVNYFS